MSQLYHLYVADESEAEEIVERSRDKEYVNVPAFWESKQLTLLSLFRKVPKPPSFFSANFYKAYHKHFELLYQLDEYCAECYAAKFPHDFVKELAATDHNELSSLADRWMNVEPSFAEHKWTKEDVEGLLNKICSTCQNAVKRKKHVVYRFSL
ncbi:MAG: hypothetical protein DKT66_16750 [Candidatus Melainabacteria bacterium]|nr:MAG: hypothetical protein DKT66_16750 [Candidatus Melainabacteria bacterium]